MALIAYYALDEAAMDDPDVAADSSGNGFDGVYQGPDIFGANTPVAGHLGNGMMVSVPTTYPGADLYGHAGMLVQSVTDFSFSGAVAPYTIDFWLYLGGTDVTQRRALIGAYDPTVGPTYYPTWGFWIEGGETVIRFFRGSFSVAPGSRDEVVTPSLTPGTWYEIRGVFDGTDLIVYVDGTVEDTTPSTGISLSAAAGSLSVGGGVPLMQIFGASSFRYPPNESILDEVKVYDSIPATDGATVAYYGGVAQ